MARGFDSEEIKPDTVSDEDSVLKLIENFGKKKRGK